jgi:iron complex transport system ATP-binding protein
LTPLEARNLTARFGDRVVLQDAALTLRESEVVTLIGPNGSGKSTLLRAVLGMIPSVGEVRWWDAALASCGPRRLAAAVAYMPQHPAFEPGDRVIDVLRLGRSPHQSWLGIERDEDERVVQDVAARLDLRDLLGRGIETLSGGQRQRVFLGRCLAQQPRALLLDEPATFLDLRHQVELYKLLRTLASERQIAVLMASHDLNLAATHADRAVVLKAGRVIAHGVVSESMSEAVLTEAFDVPMRRIDVDGRAVLVPLG